MYSVGKSNLLKYEESENTRMAKGEKSQKRQQEMNSENRLVMGTGQGKMERDEVTSVDKYMQIAVLRAE